MCEPSHSIVQFPTHNPETHDPITSLVRGAMNTAKAIQLADSTPEQAEIIKSSVIIPQGAIIGNFINYSRMGSGHSESMGKLPEHIRIRLPEDVKYEAQWWERRVKLDSRVPSWVKHYGPADSLQSAEDYANRASMGDIKIFRRFLETSLKLSDRPSRYSYYILEILSPKGKEALGRALSRFSGGKKVFLSMTLSSLLEGPQKDIVIGMIMKVTRKRENLIDLWADDKAWNDLVLS